MKMKDERRFAALPRSNGKAEKRLCGKLRQRGAGIRFAAFTGGYIYPPCRKRRQSGIRYAHPPLCIRLERTRKAMDAAKRKADRQRRYKAGNQPTKNLLTIDAGHYGITGRISQRGKLKKVIKDVCKTIKKKVRLRARRLHDRYLYLAAWASAMAAWSRMVLGERVRRWFGE